jgi:hypothetical protein
MPPQVALVGKAQLRRHRHRSATVLKHLSGAPYLQQEMVVMRRNTNVARECSHEMESAQTGHNDQLIERDVIIQSVVQVFSYTMDGGALRARTALNVTLRMPLKEEPQAVG